MKKKIHFLDWRRARMACGKKSSEVYSSAYYWSMVDCRKCLAREALGEVNA